MKTCSTCGCYIPDNWNKCPACEHIEKIVKIEKPKEQDKVSYIPLHTILFGNEPIGYYPDYVSSSWNEKVYNRLKNAIFLFIQNDKDFQFWNRSKIKEIPAFSNVGLIAIDDMLFCLADEGKIEMYGNGIGWESNYYRRLPQTKEEEHNRKKFYNRRYKRLVFHY